MMTDPAASRPGTHLDPDQMADLFEGLLDRAAAEAARTHLASCPLCSGDFALIVGEGDLGELLPPAPIPQDVVIRIEAALHREPPLGAAPAPAGHSAPPRRRRFRLALGSLAGATLVIAGGIGVLTATNSGSGSRSSTANSAVAGGAPSSTGGDSSRGAGKSAGQVPGGETPQLGSPPDSASRTPFGDLSIEQQARNLLGHGTLPASGTTQSGRPQCRPQGVAADARPLAGTQIQYQGRPAELLVYAEPGSTTLADVYVVDLDSCTPDNPGQILDQTVITRP